ncbi:hypothetical protein BC940DRAFT_332348 [Gongronella butleri]|nr:hypothetical protein BC940DRAFT_332348 [Gongronella butleri]
MSTLPSQDDDWCARLAMVEFAYNNGLHDDSIRTTPFHALYGFHPALLDVHPFVDDNPAAIDRTNDMVELMQVLHDDNNLARAQEQRYNDTSKQQRRRACC